MKIYEEKKLQNFEFWDGARYVINHLTPEELDTIETILEELYPDGVEDTFVNDLFWHEPDTVAQWLGYEDFEELIKKQDERGEF